MVEHRASLWPRSLTYDSKKIQNPFMSQESLKPCVCGLNFNACRASWVHVGPGPAPGSAGQWLSPWRPGRGGCSVLDEVSWSLILDWTRELGKIG